MTRRYTPEQREARRVYMLAWREKHKERLKAYRADPKVKARHARRCRKNYRKNPEKSREYHRRYRAKHGDKSREISRRWKRENPDRVRESNKRFIAKNPTYWRDWQMKKRRRQAWLKWARTCAANRRQS